MGNDGNEFKIITQTFLYKFLNDKFAFEAKKIDESLAKAEKWEEALGQMSEGDLEMLQLQQQLTVPLVSSLYILYPSTYIMRKFTAVTLPITKKPKFSKLKTSISSNLEIGFHAHERAS